MSVTITHELAYTVFQLVPTSMTLNDLKRVITLILCFFSPISIALQTDYVTVVEDGPMMSAKYRILVPFFHFWPKLTQPTARSLCDS